MKNSSTSLKDTSRKPWLAIAMMVFVCVCWSNTNLVYATSDNADLAINANINAKCMFKTNGVTVSFGNYDPIVVNLLLPILSSSTFAIKCNKNTSSQIAMGDGLNAGHAIVASRAMSNGFGDYLSYEIFTSSARSLIWNATNTVGYTDLGGISTIIPVFATVPAAQNVSPGFYTDTVTMTIIY